MFKILVFICDKLSNKRKKFLSEPNPMVQKDYYEVSGLCNGRLHRVALIREEIARMDKINERVSIQ